MATKKVKRTTAVPAPSLADRLNAGAGTIVQEEEVAETPDVDGAADDASPEVPVEAPEIAVEAVEDKPWLTNPQRPKDGVIVGPGEPISANGVVQGSQVVLQERVYRAHKLPKSVRWGYLLLYPKGHRIALAKLTTVNGQAVVDGKITLSEKLSNGDTIKMPSHLAA